MTVHVAVLDPLPAYRHGVAAMLSGIGLMVEQPTDAIEWVNTRPDGVVLLTLHSAEDLELLTALCRIRPRPLVIALPSGEVPSTGVQAVRAGARSVVARAATVPVLQRAVSATLDGEAIMPAVVADLLVAGRGGRPQRRSAPSEQQIAWLRRLSGGWTVVRLASETGYSERAMYRLLQTLYQQLGVRTRLEAIMVAQEEGWFEDNI